MDEHYLSSGYIKLSFKVCAAMAEAAMPSFYYFKSIFGDSCLIVYPIR